MFLSKTLLSLTLLPLSTVDASPLGRELDKSTLRVAKRLNLDAHGAIGTIAAKDRARVQTMKQTGRHGNRDSSSVDIANAGVVYAAQVGIGEPPNYYTIVVDTGSSNTWVGANQTRPYIPTHTSIDTGDYFSIPYEKSSVFGEEWLDTVTLSPNVVIKNQSIGAATFTVGFHQYDGILGVGPTDLDTDTIGNTKTVPTVMDNLLAQKLIAEEVLGVFFVPFAENPNNGELTFGGYDNNVITSPVTYTPITKTYPASRFWGVDQSVTYGDQIILSGTAGIVDTGTSFVLIATDALEKYMSATGAVLDQTTGFLAITPAQYAQLKMLRFHIGGTSYELTANAQIWPRALNTDIGGNSSMVYLIVNDIGTRSGSGLDVVNGYMFLERFYSVFDTINHRVGFATTAYTYCESN